MKKSIALRLARELESGKWRKAKGQLGRGKKCRCCLGVLQEVAPKRLQKSPLVRSFPSGEVCAWADMGSYLEGRLAWANDETSGWAETIKLLRDPANHT